MDKGLLEKIDKYYDEDEHEKIIELINSLPDEECDYEAKGLLAVALNNLDRYDEAIEILGSIADEGSSDRKWYYRIGYAYYYSNKYNKAAEAFKKAIELIKQEENPDSELLEEYIEYLTKCNKKMVQKKYMQNKSLENKSISEPIEIIYSEEDGEYKVIKGVVDLGYMGVYSTDGIDIDFDENSLAEVFEEEKDTDYYKETYLPLKPYLREDMTKDEIAKGLTAFYNARIADIQKHQTALNQVFLAYILDDLNGCGFPLWEDCTDYIIQDKMPECDEDDLYDVFYSDEASDAIEELYYKLEEKANNGEVDNSSPAEDIFRKYFPMFDLDKFLADIYGEYLHLSNANISFQCSGEGQALDIACAAYAEITINNSFYDWHNH